MSRSVRSQFEATEKKREQMEKPAGSFSLHIDHLDGYEFKVHFDRPDMPDLVVDEPPPLGQDHGPNPARLLAGAIGSCLSASLLFCLKRAKVPIDGLRSDVEVQLVRNERQRLRLGPVKVRLYPRVAAGLDFRNCLEQFEDFCVVTQSVREGIDVEVEVKAEPNTISTADAVSDAPAAAKGPASREAGSHA